MKDIVFGKVYDTKSAYLAKERIVTEDLGGGYTRYKIVRLYIRERSKDFFLYICRESTDNGSKIIDICEYIKPVTEEYARSFNNSTDLTFL